MLRNTLPSIQFTVPLYIEIILWYKENQAQSVVSLGFVISLPTPVVWSLVWFWQCRLGKNNDYWKQTNFP